MRPKALATVLFTLLILSVPRIGMAERAGSKVFFFGNSLVQHESETPQTSTVYWLGHLAKAAGKDLTADGTFGFLREFARKLPPEPQWNVSGVSLAWRGDFATTGYDAVVLTPANFIQYQPADEPYDWQNSENISPLDASRSVFEWLNATTPGTRLFVYEGWADMGGKVRSFPPSNRQLRKYHRLNGEDYHDWYVDYVSALGVSLPSNPPQLIPVASVLSKVFQMSELDGLAANDLYTDDAPHGTPSMYFLAALVTYASLFEVAPPVQLELPGSIHPLIRNNYDQIAGRIADLMGTKSAALMLPDADQNDAPPVTQPSLAMGLAGVHDWGTQYAFLDVMKTARPWLGHKPGQWGGFETERLETEGYLDENGWPMEIPAEVEKLESYLLMSDVSAYGTDLRFS